MSVEISVIIPTFRRPALLREAIESVLAQTQVPLEIIVIDDSPEGSAAAVVAEFSDSVCYIKNPQPTGGIPSVVRNLGWPTARGRFIHFLDDDDRVPAGHYRAAIAAFESNPGVGVVFGRVAPFGDPPEWQLLAEED